MPVFRIRLENNNSNESLFINSLIVFRHLTLIPLTHISNWYKVFSLIHIAVHLLGLNLPLWMQVQYRK